MSPVKEKEYLRLLLSGFNLDFNLTCLSGDKGELGRIIEGGRVKMRCQKERKGGREGDEIR